MSRTEETPDGAGQHDVPPQWGGAGSGLAEREAREFADETGYRPSVNQRRHEPLPASHHDERRQEAVLRNEEHSSRTQAAPSRRARRRGDGKQ